MRSSLSYETVGGALCPDFITEFRYGCHSRSWSRSAKTWTLVYTSHGIFHHNLPHDREHGLTEPGMQTGVLNEMRRLETEGVWHLHTAVVMPDHVHLLVTISESGNLAWAVRLFKGCLTPTLRKAGLRWQQAYFDHRMRSEEDRLPVLLYIFLNPYRARLLPQGDGWPGYYCSGEDWSWFEALANERVPMPEWLL